MFAFSQVDPRTSGQVSDMAVPLSRYFGAAFEQGEHDSMFANIYNARELSLEESDPANPKLLQPEEANNKYSLPGLKWDKPVAESVANLLHNRQQAELDRQYFLSQDNHSIAAGVAGMGTRMLGSMLNPLDLGTLFLPVVGEGGKLAEGANVLGRGAFRSALSRGLLSSEAVAVAVPAAPQLAKSVIQGLAWQTLAQGVNIATRPEPANIKDLEAIGMGGLFAGGMHMAITGAFKMLQGLSSGVHEALVAKAMDDFAKGKDISVEDLVKAGTSPDDAWKQAALMPGESEAPERVTQAALRHNGTDIYPGFAHYDAWEKVPAGDKGLDEMGNPEPGSNLESGFMTNRGRFIDREEAAKMAGVKNSVPGELHSGDMSKPPEPPAKDPLPEILDKERAKTSQKDPKLEAENKKSIQDGKTLAPAQVEEAKIPAQPEEKAAAKIEKENQDLMKELMEDPDVAAALSTELTEEELKQVRGESGEKAEEVKSHPLSDKEWFHGTGSGKFTEFKGTPFFTTDKEGAKAYAEEYGRAKENGERESVIHQAKLNIKNPLDLTKLENMKELWAIAKEAGVKIVHEYDEKNGIATFMGHTHGEKNLTMNDNFFDLMYDPRFRKALEKHGYDAMYGHDILENGEIETIVPTKASQATLSGSEEVSPSIKNTKFSDANALLPHEDKIKALAMRDTNTGEVTIVPAGKIHAQALVEGKDLEPGFVTESGKFKPKEEQQAEIDRAIGKRQPVDVDAIKSERDATIKQIEQLRKDAIAEKEDVEDEGRRFSMEKFSGIGELRRLEELRKDLEAKIAREATGPATDAIKAAADCLTKKIL